MNSVFICYPALFKCYSKFERKLCNIVKNLESPTLIYMNDENDLIADYVKSHLFSCEAINEWSLISEKMTHAVIFDDGEEFPGIIQEIKNKEVPIRIINITITRVINIKKETDYNSQKSTPYYEYIGRGSYWGNPYSMYDDGDGRDEVIRKYKYDFDFDKFPNKNKSEVYKLAGKRLGCFCKPQSCHGDILADFLNSWDDGR